MENTINIQQELTVARKKAAKPMLWISLVSMTMMFAGLVSAYVISSNREDWVSFDLPTSLVISTVLIIISSFTIHAAVYFGKKENKNLTSLLLIITLGLGIGFVISQFNGFNELKASGLFFTGPKSLISSSMLMVIVGAHLLHIFAALIVLIVMLTKQLLGKYNNGNTLGLELGSIFWHFLDLLWIALFLFFYFNT
ncbi:cytochrome c oxidase subunit 3 [Wenyingzhuangia sp. 2_MG-2023]|uniref:cytochrome c oxidase subunit 3 n=1 Tax=Wenyingzhuangia sp. 2_MG-2023 TaxID=3062639 RepID=UPI0026E420FE|nr:cytochrome c oxidase subunit 3 [Wenyingzhuangia sp. 2_MG-2023]MDO6736232.1 cytochrome c oxidase subunit 3 [Wenyingzhuangia sp. 2_MG-2023]MDO6801464.1 cytochrome c oxidase subunit 3 [Wenyingzhuangia sp. 1_MG-2023]